MSEECKHNSFRVQANVARITEEEGGPAKNFLLEVQVWCDQCNEPFEFVSLPVGLSFDKPTANVDFTEAHLPIRPATGVLATKLSYEMPKESGTSSKIVN